MAKAETWGPFSLDKAYLIRCASSCHWYGLWSKKSLHAVSPNLTSWCLACSYSGGGCAGRLVVYLIAFPNALENRNSSQVAFSSLSSFISRSLFFLAGLSSRLPFLDPSPTSSISQPPGVPGAPFLGGGGWFPPFPPPAAMLLSGVGSDCFPFPFTWYRSESSIVFISARCRSLSSRASLWLTSSIPRTFISLSWLSNCPLDPTIS